MRARATITKPGPDEKLKTAKLFMHGGSQAVRLPKEFRFEGTEVTVRRVGDAVVLEPLRSAPFDVDAWWARVHALGEGVDFLPEGRPEQPPMPDDDEPFPE